MGMQKANRVGRSITSIACLAVFTTSAFPSLLWAAQAFQESSGQVVMEAEHFDNKIARSSHDWVLETSLSGAAGSAYMSGLPSSGASYDTGYVTTSPELVFNVSFTKTGTYYVWVRGSAPTASDDSVHAGIDGTGPASADRISGLGTGWTWKMTTMDSSAPATLAITTPGLHTIHLWVREDGCRIDRMLLRTSSSTTAPSGSGPAESARVTVNTDTTPPTGSIMINAGAAATNQAQVTLTLAATDSGGPVSQMQLSNDNVTYSAAEPYLVSKVWPVSTGDGTKTVYVKFSDAAGNWSTPVSDTIVLDTVPPQVAITSPADGAVITATTP